MKTLETNLHTIATFSEDGSKRYLLQKSWDSKLPRLTIIMVAPSTASAVALDTTTQLVLNNASRLGFGMVSIVNLFATLNDFALKEAETEDADNLKVIVQEAEKADVVVYAAGIGKSKNKSFILRQQQVLNALRSYESKLNCLTNEDGNARLQHPLSPAVRTWHLSPLKIEELLPEPKKVEPTPEPIKEKKPQVRVVKKEPLAK